MTGRGSPGAGVPTAPCRPRRVVPGRPFVGLMTDLLPMNRLPSCFGFVLAALLLGTGLPATGLLQPATAQTTRTLVIEDGVVRIDGQPVPESQWPASLDVRGVRAQYQFVGIQRPVVELDGRLYAVTDRLEPVPEDSVRSANASVVLRNLDRREPAGGPSNDLQAAHEEYLHDVERRSRKLYERLLRERRMEQQTYDLARTIERLPEGPERQAQIDTLRATLNRIFDLKQENRRREIDQLQRQIAELQNSLKQRERMREEMIDRRLQQLVDAARSQ